MHSLKNILLFLIINPFSGFTQQAWTLEQCITQGMISNNDVQNAALDFEFAELELSASKYRFLPAVNAGLSHGYNWGQTIDPFTNQFANKRVQYNNLFVSGNATIFSGFQQGRWAKILHLSAAEKSFSLELAKRNLEGQIVDAFYEVLLNSSVITINEDLLGLIEEQKLSTEILIKEGSRESIELMELNAEVVKQKAALLRSKNDLKISLILLQQLINQPYDSAFNVMDESTIKPIITSIEDSVYSAELEMSKLILERQMYEVKRVKGQYFPSITLSGSLGSGYSGNNLIALPSGQLIQKPFDVQFKDNFYQSVSLGLTIPIFNRLDTRTEVSRANINQLKAAAEIEQLEQEITSSFLEYHFEINSIESELEAAKFYLSYAKENLDSKNKKYAAGAFDFKRLFEAQQTYINAKLEVIRLDYLLKATTRRFSVLFT